MKQVKINQGKIVGNMYVKRVSFSKAVLWKDREISIHKDIAEKWLTNHIKFVRFIDMGKGEEWTANLDKVKKSWKLKQVGQEPQYYIPIEIFSIKKYLINK